MTARPILALLALLAAAACTNGESAIPADTAVHVDTAMPKGGDDRTGPYDPVEGWWKPAEDHVDG